MRQACAAAIFLMLGGPALAQAPACQKEYASVQREVEAARLSTDKTAQVNALLEQVSRACKEKNDVVAMAGIDQVRAILSDERKAGSGS